MNDIALIIMLVVAAIGAFFALGPWRLAFYATVVLGFLQDPLRKVIDGQPVVLVMLSTIMMMAAFFGASLQAGGFSLRPMTLGNQRAKVIVIAFIVLVLMQSVVGFVRFGSIQVALIGVIAYLAPMPALWLSSRFLRRDSDLIRFLWVYCGFALIVAASIHAGKVGIKGVLLEEVGEGVIVYDRIVGMLETFPGFMRATEIAAWHMATGCCFLIILAVATQSRKLWWMLPPFIAVLLTASLMTGRRKSLVAVAIFAGIYLLLMLAYRQRTASKMLLLSAGLVLLMMIGTFLTGMDTASGPDPYLTRGHSVWGDLVERFAGLGLASVFWAINAAGFLGLGAGSVGQGAQYFGGASVGARGAAEGGLGKIIVELGVPGLILAIGVVFILMRTVRLVLAASRVGSPRVLRLVLGLVAICATNVSVFITASQAFGDPFILFMLGSCAGFVLAAPRMIQSHLQDQYRKAAVPPSTSINLGREWK